MQKRNYTPEYKTKIVLEVLEGDRTAGEIAAREEINPKMLSGWKQEFLRNAHRAFTVSGDALQLKQELKASEARENELVAKVGVLTMENDWLKKKHRDALGYEPAPAAYNKR